MHLLFTHKKVPTSTKYSVTLIRLQLEYNSIHWPSCVFKHCLRNVHRFNSTSTNYKVHSHEAEYFQCQVLKRLR